MKKEMNYTIEFFRFMFACNFVLLHVLIIGARKLGGAPLFLNGFDVIIPFMAFSGYFLMRSFQKQKANGELEKKTPARLAWEYLKARLISLLPLTFVTTLACIIANCIWFHMPFMGGVMYTINSVTELFGLQISGMYGNDIYGIAAEKGISAATTAGPLWFISGVFFCGYAIYYLLAKDEDGYVGWKAPLFLTLFYGVSYLNNMMPMWNSDLIFGGLNFPSGLFHMFGGMSIGVLLYVAINNLKDVKWTGGAKLVFSIIQLFCVVVVFFKSWVSITSPLGQAFHIGWGATFFITTVFTFFCLLNVDYVTRCPIFSSKIWRIPGRLALYIYMVHYPLLSYCMLAMGMTTGTYDANVGRLMTLYFVVLVVSVVVGYLVMIFEDKVLHPWLKSSPWAVKENEE